MRKVEEMTNREILEHLFRKVTRIEQAIGLIKDRAIGRLTRKLDRSTTSLDKAVKANQPVPNKKKS